MRIIQKFSLLLLSLSHASGENTLANKQGLRKVSEATTATIFGGEKIPVARMEETNVASEAPSISPSLAPSVGPSAKGDLESASPSHSPSITGGVGAEDGTDPSQAPSISPTLSVSPSTTLSVAPSASPSVAKGAAKTTSQPSQGQSLAPSLSKMLPNGKNVNGAAPKEQGKSPKTGKMITYVLSFAAVALILLKFVQYNRKKRLMKERELVMADANSFSTDGHLHELFDGENGII